MNKGLMILNGILGVAVIVLFYLHFSEKQGVRTNGSKDIASVTTVDGEVIDSINQFLNLDSNISAKPIKIAFVDSDSLDNNLKMLKDVKAALEKKEAELEVRITNEKKKYENSFKAKIAAFDKRRSDYAVKAPTLTDAQLQKEQQALQSMQEELGGLEQKFQMEMMNFQGKIEEEYMRLKTTQMADYYGKVKAYCESIAKKLGFDFILIYQKGGTILHANDAYNISKYVIEGINKEYDSKK